MTNLIIVDGYQWVANNDTLKRMYRKYNNNLAIFDDVVLCKSNSSVKWRVKTPKLFARLITEEKRSAVFEYTTINKIFTTLYYHEYYDAEWNHALLINIDDAEDYIGGNKNILDIAERDDVFHYFYSNYFGALFTKTYEDLVNIKLSLYAPKWCLGYCVAESEQDA